jgi:hypothetical protein
VIRPKNGIFLFTANDSRDRDDAENRAIALSFKNTKKLSEIYTGSNTRNWGKYYGDYKNKP